MIESDNAVMAQTYVASGWQVFPLYWVSEGHCVCSAGSSCSSPGKHPLTGRGLYDASVDQVQVARWWHTWPDAHIGLPADANGLAVLDVDPRHGGTQSLMTLMAWLDEQGEPLQKTLTQITGSGGFHLVYAAPEGGVPNGANVFGRDMPGLDTRGRGGYIVAAPSLHLSGRQYEWVDFFAELAPWPRLLTRLMDDR